MHNFKLDLKFQKRTCLCKKKFPVWHLVAKTIKEKQGTEKIVVYIIASLKMGGHTQHEGQAPPQAARRVLHY